MELLAVDVVCVVFIFVLLMLVCVVFTFVLLMLVWVGAVLRPRGRAWVVLVSRSLSRIKFRRHRSHLGADRTPHIDSSLSRKIKNHFRLIRIYRTAVNISIFEGKNCKTLSFIRHGVFKG